MLGSFSFISEGSQPECSLVEPPNLNFLWTGKEEELLTKKVSGSQ